MQPETGGREKSKTGERERRLTHPAAADALICGALRRGLLAARGACVAHPVVVRHEIAPAQRQEVWVTGQESRMHQGLENGERGCAQMTLQQPGEARERRRQRASESGRVARTGLLDRAATHTRNRTTGTCKSSRCRCSAARRQRRHRCAPCRCSSAARRPPVSERKRPKNAGLGREAQWVGRGN